MCWPVQVGFDADELSMNGYSRSHHCYLSPCHAALTEQALLHPCCWQLWRIGPSLRRWTVANTKTLLPLLLPLSLMIPFLSTLFFGFFLHGRILSHKYQYQVWLWLVVVGCDWLWLVVIGLDLVDFLGWKRNGSEHTRQWWQRFQRREENQVCRIRSLVLVWIGRRTNWWFLWRIGNQLDLFDCSHHQNTIRGTSNRQWHK